MTPGDETQKELSMPRRQALRTGPFRARDFTKSSERNREELRNRRRPNSVSQEVTLGLVGGGNPGSALSREQQDQGPRCDESCTQTRAEGEKVEKISRTLAGRRQTKTWREDLD